MTQTEFEALLDHVQNYLYENAPLAEAAHAFAMLEIDMDAFEFANLEFDQARESEYWRVRTLFFQTVLGKIVGRQYQVVKS